MSRPSTDHRHDDGADHDVRPAGTDALTPYLARLNERGFRLVQVMDALAVVVLLVGSMVVRDGWDWPTYSMGRYAASFAVITVVTLTVLYLGGLYDREPRLGAPSVLPRVVRLVALAAVIIAALNLVATSVGDGGGRVRALPIPTANFIVVTVLEAFVLTANRWLVVWRRRRREGPPRVLLIGGPTEVTLASRHLAEDPDQVQVVGDVRVDGDVVGAALRDRATDVLVLEAEALDVLFPATIEACERNGLSVLQRVGPVETLLGIERIRQVGGMPMALLRTHAVTSSRRRSKRVWDLLLLAVLAPALVPLLLLVFAYQAIAAGRPLFFVQDRVGRDGEVFRMVKFRTMVEDAERLGPQLATKSDPRVIDACRWVRNMRFDELPQLWHVLRGEMSLVGPRPERPELTAEFDQQIPGYARRTALPPGLTGLAQVHGRYHTDPAYKLGYDLQYLADWSPVLDLEILFRTVVVVLTGRV